MFASGNICMSELINENDVRFASKNCVQIHFFECGAFVFDFAARDGFELRGKLFNASAAMRFDDADDDVFAAGVAPNGFAEHAVRFPNARSITKKQLEAALGFFARGGDFEPVFWFLGQVSRSLRAKAQPT